MSDTKLDKKNDKEIKPKKKVKAFNNVKVVKDPLFNIGDIVKHRIYPFRGVIIDVDAEFSNTEEWYQSIPAEIRPSRKQPYYHLMAENSETFYSAYVSQQNLVNDGVNGPLEHPDLEEIFNGIDKGKYLLKNEARN
ncbi:heat shock protein HspQ [Alphaproteobacteria bacterium]|nr:heat shock protein HspQ [Alphaproteobacteria bacterium]MDB9870658.1 heat shock protein HspQ [Alphaproteobacteria bacterium]